MARSGADFLPAPSAVSLQRYRSPRSLSLLAAETFINKISEITQRAGKRDEAAEQTADSCKKGARWRVDCNYEKE